MKPASLRPGPITRLMDRIVMAVERAEARIETARAASETESRERLRSVVIFGALTVFYAVFGKPEHTSLFFASAGLIAFAGKAWHLWRQPPRGRIAASERDGVRGWFPDVVAGVVANLAFAAVVWMSLPEYILGFAVVTTFSPAVVAALAYRRRTPADPRPESLFVSGGVLLSAIALMALMECGGGY